MNKQRSGTNNILTFERRLSKTREGENILRGKFITVEKVSARVILESAINRPYQTFDQNELYPNPVDKVPAIFESIVSNHPFVDGNKRTA